jgi:hypothetical protein
VEHQRADTLIGPPRSATGRPHIETLDGGSDMPLHQLHPHGIVSWRWQDIVFVSGGMKSLDVLPNGIQRKRGGVGCPPHLGRDLANDDGSCRKAAFIYQSVHFVLQLLRRGVLPAQPAKDVGVPCSQGPGLVDHGHTRVLLPAGGDEEVQGSLPAFDAPHGRHHAWQQ